MRTLSRPLVLLAFTLVAACASIKVDPAFYRADRVALVAFHGDESIVGTAGMIAALQSGNTWGSDAIAQVYAAGAPRIAQAMEAATVDAAQVVAAPSYATLPLWTSARASAGGLAPLRENASDIEGLARLARELDVDAVVTVAFDWRVDADPDGNQRGVVTMRLTVVGDDGAVLWSQSEVTESTAPDSVGQIGRELVGTMSKDSAVEMVRTAALVAIEHFATAVRKGRG